jgi:transcription antitermination factor NusG
MRPSWYAVHVRSNFEKKVAGELAAKGLESYLPSVTEVHNWKDRKKVIDVPLFPGYVFTRFCDTPASRLAVLRTAGTARILGCQDSIEAIPDYEIESIQRLLWANVPLLIHPLLQEGSVVRILRGPLRDLEGLLVRIKNQARLVLSVELLSRSVSTEVNVRDVVVVRPTRLWPRPAGYSSQAQ